MVLVTPPPARPGARHAARPEWLERREVGVGKEPVSAAKKGGPEPASESIDVAEDRPIISSFVVRTTSRDHCSSGQEWFVRRFSGLVYILIEIFFQVGGS